MTSTHIRENFYDELTTQISRQYQQAYTEAAPQNNISNFLPSTGEESGD